MLLDRGAGVAPLRVEIIEVLQLDTELWLIRAFVDGSRSTQLVENTPDAMGALAKYYEYMRTDK